MDEEVAVSVPVDFPDLCGDLSNFPRHVLNRAPESRDLTGNNYS